MDSAGNIALGFSVSSSSTFPSLRYVTRSPGDPLGTLPGGEVECVAGTGAQINSFNRWGDYSTISVDPAADCTFWVTSEYYQTTSNFNFKTRICSFTLPGCEPCNNDVDCDDSLFCNGAETCNAGSCQAGTPPMIDDLVACTDDSCDEVSDSILNTPNDANCVDAVFCDGAETCDSVDGCVAGTDPCPGQTCDEFTDTCGGGVCNNNGICEVGEDCNNCSNDCIGRQTGRPQNRYCCGDATCEVNENSDNCAVDCAVACTFDSDCDDGSFCNGAETCDSGSCQPGTPVDCDDVVGCTDDSCNEGTDSCDNVANDGNCDDGLFCNGVETCDPLLDCQAGGGDPCPNGESCNEANDICGNCLPKNLACSLDSECCSLFCKPNGKCR